MSERTIGILDLVKPTTWAAKARDIARAAPLLVIFVIALAITAMLNPAKVGLTIFGLAKLSMGGFVGYWIARFVAPYARPHLFLVEGKPKDPLSAAGFAAALLFRAIVVATCVISAGFIP